MMNYLTLSSPTDGVYLLTLRRRKDFARDVPNGGFIQCRGFDLQAVRGFVRRMCPARVRKLSAKPLTVQVTPTSEEHARNAIAD